MQAYLNLNSFMLKSIFLGLVFSAHLHAVPTGTTTGTDAASIDTKDGNISLCNMHGVKLNCDKSAAYVSSITNCMTCPVEPLSMGKGRGSLQGHGPVVLKNQTKVQVNVLWCPYLDTEGLCPPPNCGDSLGAGFVCSEVGSSCIPWKNNKNPLSIGTCSPANLSGGVAALSLNVTTTGQ